MSALSNTRDASMDLCSMHVMCQVSSSQTWSEETTSAYHMSQPGAGSGWPCDLMFTESIITQEVQRSGTGCSPPLDSQRGHRLDGVHEHVGHDRDTYEEVDQAHLRHKTVRRGALQCSAPQRSAPQRGPVRYSASPANRIARLRSTLAPGSAK